MKRPKYRLPISSFAMVREKYPFRGRASATMRKHTPNIRAISTMLEPKTLPMDTPMLPGSKTPKMDTLSSGKEVENPTKIKPTVVFPKPVISETLIELFMVKSLALPRTISEAIRISKLPINPVSANSIASPFL
jgi:hypothetical protein